jgi:large subunit ribosomal protein L18
MKRLIKVQFRRRRENKTNYTSRARKLSGRMARLVVRRSNRYLIAQIVTSQTAQDKVIFTVNSKELTEYGWPEMTSIKNLAAGYLLGVLVAAKAKKNNIEKATLDLGLFRSTKGNKLYAIAKGAIDAGLDVPHSKEILPPMDRIERKDATTKVDVKKIKENILSKNK